MKIKFKRILIVLSFCFLFAAVACSNQQEEPQTNSDNPTQQVGLQEEPDDTGNSTEAIELFMIAPSGPPTLSLLNVLTDENSLGEQVSIQYEITTSTDVLSAKTMQAEADIAVVPSNLAATLYNKGVPYQVVSLNSWGNLYVISTDDSIQSWEDLKGKEISSMGRGLVPDITFRYLLAQNGLVPDEDITIDYLSGAPEVATNFIGGQTTLAVVSEPSLSQVMIKNPDTHIVLDLQNEWANSTPMEQGFPQIVMIVKQDLIDNHPGLVATLLEKVEENIQWVNQNPEAAGELAEELHESFQKEAVANGIGRMHLDFTPISSGHETLASYYQVLMETSADLVGGNLPDEGFYYQVQP